jgi:beta-glucosidase
VMSDWKATHSTSLTAGLDIEMPASDFMNASAIKALIASGAAAVSDVDDAVSRILTPMFAVGVMDEPASSWDWAKLHANVTSAASVASARRLSSSSTVLLKNAGGVLPLKSGASGLGSVAVLGFGSDNAIVHAGGSGSVVPSHVATPLEGLRAKMGPGAKLSFSNGTDIAAAAALAASHEVAIVFAATLSSEGYDRASLSLDDGCPADPPVGRPACDGNTNRQNALISAVARANKRTVVVLSVPGAVLTPWREEVAAVLVNFMPGQQAGNAIADVLFGDVNPSARLPLTFPSRENETALTPAQWPGTPGPLPGAPEPNCSIQLKPDGSVIDCRAHYSERLLVGYRYYDAKQIEPAFPFGHGLSYTTFAISNLVILQDLNTSDTSVQVALVNTGSVAGATIVQLYLGFPAAAGEPPQQLKGFVKQSVEPGQKVQVAFTLTARDRSVWDVGSHAWAAVKGTFTVSVGLSSRDPKAATAPFVVH